MWNTFTIFAVSCEEFKMVSLACLIMKNINTPSLMLSLDFQEK